MARNLMSLFSADSRRRGTQRFARSFVLSRRYQQVHKLFSKQQFLLKSAVIMCNYTEESVVTRMRPNPDLCKFLQASEVASLAKDGGSEAELYVSSCLTRRALSGQ